jgi:ferredoxin
MDAIVAMEGEGPSAGDPVKMGLLLASPDPVSLDIVVSWITGFKPSDILTSVDAVERGLGPQDFEDIEVVGCRVDEVVRSDFKKPSTYRGKIKRTLIRILTPFGLRFFRNFPATKDSICTKCGICEERCPVEAIKMNPYPEFNYDKCIQCFCCHELCPSGAIYIKKGTK